MPDTSHDYDDTNVDDVNDDQIMEPTVRHTSSIGYRTPPDDEGGFLPIHPVDRYPRAAQTPSSSTPRVFEELIDLISPPFGHQQQHDNNIRATTNNNNFNNFPPNSFPTATTPHQQQQQQFSTSFSNNNQASQAFNNNGFQSTRGFAHSTTTPIPQSFPSQSQSFQTTSAAAVASQKLVLNSNQSFGRLKTGNGQPVPQESKPPKGKKNKKNKNKNKNENVLFGVEIVDQVSEKRQGKQSKQPTLTFLNPDLQASSSSNSLSKLSGRQPNKIPGFPSGLPAQVPEGVRIALQSAQIGELLDGLDTI